jgi:protein-arginine deiminase
MLKPTRPLLALLAAAALPGAAACDDAKPLEGKDEDAPLVADIDADTNRDGVIDTDDDADEDGFSAGHGAVLIANVDDDDGDGIRDSRDEVLADGPDLDDLTPVHVRKVLGLDGHTLTLALGPPAALSAVRVWRKDGDAYSVVIAPDSAGTAELARPDEDIELLVEALVPRTKDWDGNVTLTLTLAKKGKTVSEDELLLRVSPVIFPDNLQAPERLYVMDVPDGLDRNTAFVNAMRDAMPAGVELYTTDARDYDYDRWMQDNMELGYQMKPVGKDGVVVMRTAMQTQRGYGGGLDGFVPGEYLSPGQGFLFPQGADTSHNYGGNLEVSSPVDGYPFGRLIYGGGDAGTLMGRPSSDTMNDEQVAFLNAQEVQGPALEVSSEWLAVGHVDEIFQFVPDLSPDEGGKPFKVVVASPAMARDALLALQGRGGGSLVVFEGRDGSYTVDEILSAESFLALNEAGQARIDGVVAKMKEGLGLDDDDFRFVPVLYEDVGGGLVAAFNPGIQNLVTVGDRVFVPDPEGPKEDGVDIWQEATRQSLADTDLDVIFVDVFESYHRLMGEAHCGTNLDRAPYDKTWWSL